MGLYLILKEVSDTFKQSFTHFCKLYINYHTKWQLQPSSTYWEQKNYVLRRSISFVKLSHTHLHTFMQSKCNFSNNCAILAIYSPILTFLVSKSIYRWKIHHIYFHTIMYSFTHFKFFIQLGNLSPLRPHFNPLGIKKNKQSEKFNSDTFTKFHKHFTQHQ